MLIDSTKLSTTKEVKNFSLENNDFYLLKRMKF